MNKVFFFLIALLFWNNLAAQVQVLYPEIKINPLDGTLIGTSYKLPEVPQSATLPVKKDTYEIRVLPGQWAQFLVAIPHHQLGTLNIQSAENSDLQIFAIGNISVTEGEETTYPDALIPLVITTPQVARHIPETSLLPDYRKWDVFFIETPVKQKTIRITIRAAQQTVTVAIFPLPYPRPSMDFLFNFNEYGDKYLQPFRKAGYSSSKLLEIEHQIFRLFDQHNGVLNPLPYKSQKGTLRRGMGPALVNGDVLHPQLDWRAFDHRFGPLFDGTAFDDGKPIEYFYLPFNPNWPAPFELYTSDRQKYEAIWQAFAREFIRHFKEKNWTGTRFQVYMNQKPSPKNNIPWNLDEPKGVEDYRALRYFGHLTHRVFANADPLSIDFRMDISHFYCSKHRGNPKKDFRVNGGWDILAPVVDTWFISIHSLQSVTARMKARELMDLGKQVWVYGNTPAIPEPGFRAIQAVLFAHSQAWNGMLIWKTFNFTGTVRNGKDCIAYILPIQDTPTILPALRLKQLREGYQLIELFTVFQTHAEFSAVLQEHLDHFRATPTLENWLQLRILLASIPK